MFKKNETLIFIILHIVYIFCIFWSKMHFADFIKDSFFNLFFPLILYMIGFLTFIVTYKNKATFIFHILLTSIGIIVLLPNTLASYLIISLLPVILYYFCVYFLNLNHYKEASIFGNILFLLSIISMFLYIFLFAVNLYLTFLILLTLFFLIFLSYGKISSSISKYKTLLIVSTILAIAPFSLSIILHTIGIDSIFGTVETFYTFIFLPLTVGYILVEENSVAIYYEKRELIVLFGTFVSFIIGVILFMIYFLKITSFDSAIILMVFILVAYIYLMIMNHYSTNKIDNINENLYENRKVEFLHQQKFYEIKEHYMQYILKDVKNIFPNQHVFFILEEDAKVQVFMHDELMNRKQILGSFSNLKTLNKQYTLLADKEYYIVTFAVNKNILGLIGIYCNEKLTSNQLEQLNNYIEECCRNLKDVFELANLKQSYKSLPGIHPQDFVIEKYQYEIAKIQQDESQYLHDVILQKMVAVKNYLEVIETSNIEFKEYMLFELSVMNESIINHMYDLFPFTLKNLSFYECISELITRIQQTDEYKNADASISIDIEPTLNFTQRYLFYPAYSFIKELVMNTLKFADATEIIITVLIIEANLVIKVIDNGNRKNINDIIEDKYNKKNGMLFINHEVRELGGQLFIEQNEPIGSVVLIKLPISQERGG